MIFSSFIKDLRKNTEKGDADALNNFNKYKMTIKLELQINELLVEFLKKAYD